MTATESLDALAVNFADLGAFLDALLEIAPTLDDVQALTMRADLDDLLGQVKGAIGTIELRLLQVLEPGQTIQIPGVGAATISTSGKQTTQGSKLARRLAARVADTPANEDGEALPPAVLCEKTADELVAVFGLDTASTTFRKGELKKRNLRSSEFATWVDGTARVVFER